MFTNRPPPAAFILMRQEMLDAFKAWIADDEPAPDEIKLEIKRTLGAMENHLDKRIAAVEHAQRQRWIARAAREFASERESERG